jgi:hypothetical protein
MIMVAVTIIVIMAVNIAHMEPGLVVTTLVIMDSRRLGTPVEGMGTQGVIAVSA